MTETRAFDELVRWHHIQRVGFAQGWDPGWRATGGTLADNIARSDPYWGMVLDKARAAYGDPNMRFDTGNPDRDRSLVFGDGTPVPADGSLAYRDAANDRTYLLNTDGSVSPVDANGQAQQPLWPAGWRATDDAKYAPVDAHGQQIAPLLDRMPRPLTDYHDHHGVLTPKNARGDYYVDEGGSRTYFDAAGQPIGEEQYRRGTTAPGQEGDGAPLDTDEQQSGRAAEAVKKLHEELKNRYSDISDAEGQLSEVLLTARATTAEGQRKLQAVQEKIVAAIDNPALALDTPAGEQAFLKLLREQVSAIGDIVTSGALSAEDQSRAVEALTDLYAVDQRGADASDAAPESAGGTDGLGGVAAAAPPAATGEPVDLGLGPMEPLPDASLSDLGLDGLGAAAPPADPLASLTSALPAAMGAVPPAAGFGADPLSALGGLAGPLAGLASQPQTPPPSDPVASAEPADTTDEDASEDDDEKSGATTEDSDTEPAPDPTAAAPPAADTTPADTPEAPPAAVTAPLPPTTVQLPDGSTANAKTAALAEAVRSHLGGTPVEESYRQAGLELPPPGTPVTNPIDPTALSCGSIGMFEDRYVVALSSAKALQDGDVVPLSAVASGPGFLGWMDPSARAAGTPAPPVPTPALPG
ncbi:DUF4226 domain-containing protein [Mycobacterium sp. GA-2829]|uniref:DUF4226 domain-containing protein n=1 Tax=Mycobacterium sp. GA-2829 TaxID=1772283 RepID=UPI0009E76B52|nr:DUF4226 domain-containing protein [Mycobacterium sp. GA-2829]